MHASYITRDTRLNNTPKSIKTDLKNAATLSSALDQARKLLDFIASRESSFIDACIGNESRETLKSGASPKFVAPNCVKNAILNVNEVSCHALSYSNSNHFASASAKEK